MLCMLTWRSRASLTPAELSKLAQPTLFSNKCHCSEAIGFNPLLGFLPILTLDD